MISILKKSAKLLCAAGLVLCFSGCGGKEETVAPTLEPVVLPTAPIVQEVQSTDPREDVEELTVVMQPGELYTLDYYPNLKRVDLSGSTCYDAILDFMSKHPNLDVTFTIDLGGSVVSYDVDTLTLDPGSFTFEALLENLQYFPNVTGLSLPGITLNADQVTTLRETYPEIPLEYTVDVLGTTYSADTTQLDLSAMDASDISEACRALGLLTNLTDVTLSDSLTFQQVDTMQSALPDIVFHYNFTLFGKTISTGDEEVIYKNYSIDDEGLAKLREALTIMDHCKRFVLDDC